VEPKTLVHMANRIGEFFQAMPDRNEASQGVATHIRKFWDPRMRRELLAYLDQQGGKGLSEIVLSSLREHRSTLSADQVNHADRPTGG
jgi:formate dehydrogenase subunit delta